MAATYGTFDGSGPSVIVIPDCAGVPQQLADVNRWFMLLSCFVLGAGLELPYNAFITAYDYFDLNYPNREIDFVLTLAFDPTALAGFCFFFFVGDRLPLDVRVLPSFVIEFCALVAVAIFPPLVDQRVGFVLVIILMAIVGLTTAVLHLAVFGLVSTKGPECCTAMMGGIGAAGLMVSVARVITKAFFANSATGIRSSALLFFGLAAAWIVACFSAYFFLKPKSGPLAKSASMVGLEDTDLHRVLKSMRGHPWAMLCCFAFTYFSFPGMLSLIRSQGNPNLNTTEWFPIILITLYNFFNFLGSWAPLRFPPFKAGKSRDLLLFTVFRIIFPVFFALFAFAPSYMQMSGADALVYFLVIVFGATNGYLSSVAAILGPELALNGDESTAGEVMSFCLNGGIATGSVLAFIAATITASTSK